MYRKASKSAATRPGGSAHHRAYLEKLGLFAHQRKPDGHNHQVEKRKYFDMSLSEKKMRHVNAGPHRARARNRIVHRHVKRKPLLRKNKPRLAGASSCP